MTGLQRFIEWAQFQSDSIRRVLPEDGSWKREPDVWVQIYQGYHLMALRGPMFAWTGYVGVPDTHPAAQAAELQEQLKAHGGVNWKKLDIDWYRRSPKGKHTFWFGFDCCHFFDAVPGMNRKDFPQEVQEIMSRSPFATNAYRSLPYVRSEIQSLAEQLKAMEAQQ